MDNPSSMPPMPGEPIVVPASQPNTKILGVERRLIGFGFGLLLILFVLALIYTLFTDKDTMMPTSDSQPTPMMQDAPSGMTKTQPVTGPVTPDVVTSDLIDEAVADRDDLNTYTEDEIADVEDGSNY
jgi:hypothetical protein